MTRFVIRTFALPGLALAVALALAACSGSSATTAPSQAPASQAPASAEPSAAGGGTGDAVTIKDFAFNPATLTVKVGAEVTWTQGDSAAHTVTFDSGGIDSGRLSTGGTFKHTFDTAGTFTYHCAIHSSMKGTITVTQ